MSTELNAEILSTAWNEEITFPFIEDDNGNITGYGHQDEVEFAAAINRYDGLAGDGGDEAWTAADVSHDWVVLDETGEVFRSCAPEEPGAHPVTTLWVY